MEGRITEPNYLRKILSLNIKKQRKILGLTQEKLAEATNLSSQTINDIEGCRMWVSDKTILKLAKVLHVDAYRLFMPKTPDRAATPANERINDYLLDLEGKIIKIVQQQFMEAIEKSNYTSEDAKEP